MCWAIRGGWLLCQAPGSSLLLESLLLHDAIFVPQQVLWVLIGSN